ncbi:zinc metalloprotease HtpX [Archaeoglobus neptunius]|uniref:zinc metalloprotease HtpX n=1 Tax=Archaeoglobus neptunius TaxID=2798580 RepID=UPI001926FDDB|nr:zinc metalloprotease HtpX [Archaeoglobus neptunius]
MWINDRELKFRMLVTMFLLAVVYLTFLTLLAALGVNFGFLILFALLFMFLQYYLSDRIVLLSTGARIVDEGEAPELYRIVRELSSRAGLPMPRVAIINTEMPNAFATGRNARSAVVAVTTGLMKTLSRDELEAVLGHELSHIKNHDMAVLTFTSVISTLAFFVMRWAMFMGMFGSRRDSGGSAVLLFVVSSLVWLISFLLIRALSRYREYAADTGGALLTSKPRSLISALMKISRKMDFVGKEEKARVEGLSAFFIIPAVSGKTVLSLFSTHPPVEKRIERLERLAEEMGW